MKRILFFWAVILMFAASASGQQDDFYSWDFGQVKAGRVVKHAFMFKNTTGKDLKIKEVNTSCGCTVPQLKKKDLGANESTPLEVKFKTKGYSGPVAQYIYVNTDSLEEPVVKFTIKADVVK